MILLEDYNYWDKKKKRKELRTDIKDILSNYYLERIYDYKIMDFEIDLDLDKDEIEIAFFGYGRPDEDIDLYKVDPLFKLVFKKMKKEYWYVRKIDSKLFKSIKTRKTEIKLENLKSIKDNIIIYLKKKKKL